MSSRLNQLAQEAIKRLARAEFKRTSLGQLLTEAETLRSKNRLTGFRARRLSRKIASATPRNVTRELLAQLRLPDVEKYSGGAGSRFLNMLGPLGRLIRSLGRPKVTGTPVGAERELQAAMNILRAFGYKVLPPEEAKETEAAIEIEHAATQRRREAAQRAEEAERARQATREITREVERERVREKEKPEPVVEEQRQEPAGGPEMIPVKSSNVHSFGFLPGNGKTGTLLVRYLAGKGKNRYGPGPLYEYRDVPEQLFFQMMSAHSKGKFVWDELRVRGTIAGHQYSYQLAGVGLGGYVPRQAAVKRGQQGTYFIRRRLTINGTEHTSSLREAKASNRGPNYTRRPSFGIDRLSLQPNRGEPNRGRP